MDSLFKIIYDAGVVLQATLHPSGPAGKALRLLERDEVMGFLSGRVREEYEDVLYRPSVRAKNAQLTDERAQAVLEWLDQEMTLIVHPTRVIEYPRDPKDEPVVNLALTVKADYLVTRDKDLLDLHKSRDFRLLFPFLGVVDPVAFLGAVENASPSSVEILPGAETQKPEKQ
jgi:putative PIN family toxin of toxin-antitoxin system